MNRHFVGFRAEGDTVPARGDRVLIDGMAVGNATSAAYSPTPRSVIAMGYVRRPHEAPGTRVVIETEGWQRLAAVSCLPLGWSPSSSSPLPSDVSAAPVGASA